MSYKMLKKVYIKLWDKIGNTFKVKKPLKYYIVFSNELIAANDKKQLLKLLKEGINEYSSSTDLNRKLARIYTERKKWKAAEKYWCAFYEEANQISAKDIISYSAVLKSRKKYSVAKEILITGLKTYESHYRMKVELGEVYVKLKDWQSAEKLLVSAYCGENQRSQKNYIYLSYVYIKQFKFKEAKEIIQEGFQDFPASKHLMENSFELAFNMKDWHVVKDILESHTELFNEKGRKVTEYHLRLGIAYQLTGLYDEAQQEYDKVFLETDLPQLKETFIKVPLFNNGESKIEFYKKTQQVKKLCITFDSINMTWKNRPFGFKALSEQPIDIISVSKRKKYSYMQDLSYDDVYKALQTIVGGYQDVMCYGFSIGAYSALYYGGAFKSRILAIAPRNSAHPEFGYKQKGDAVFQHEMIPKNEKQVQSIVIYDPKNSIDNEYINRNLKIAYPNMIEMKYPYSGHRIATYLLSVGILKKILVRFIHNQSFEGMKKRSNDHSYQYLRNLGAECYRRNKFKWALSLIEKALLLKPDDAKSLALKDEISHNIH